MKKIILNSVIFTIIFCLGLAITYFAIKARSNTKTTTDSEPTKLYANTADTLTATKRNTLVDKVMTWEEVIVSDTAAFDSQCMRRAWVNAGAGGYIYPRHIMSSSFTMSDNSEEWIIDSNLKNTMHNGANTASYPISKIEKLCP